VLSPMMTVFVLAVLWLIVVVPMVVRRHDERRRDRSVDGFGKAMRALGRRSRTTDARSEIFVPSARESSPAVSTRRPVPVAQEALMYPVDRSEMSEARASMMKRRRRSLVVLTLGTVAFAFAGLWRGGVWWLVAGAFALGLVGYLWFLRSQALRDRERRLTRQQRAQQRRGRDIDATGGEAQFAQTPESVVRIDDDDLDLHNMETIDLTGLYQEEGSGPAQQRRAS
jgi:membrane protein implicated in regulation of membrane protease activity